MKGLKKKQESKVNPYVDAAINSEKIAAWASKNGYEWRNFSYWKNGKEVHLMDVYKLWNEWNNQKQKQ